MAVPAIAALLVVFTLHGKLPAPAPIWAVLRHADGTWLLAAAALEAVSMAAFAEQQRRLLGAFAVRMSVPGSLAVTFARSAISISLPAGSAVSAGYAFGQFRSRGASQAVAATVMLLSGVASVAGLLLLYAGNALASAVSAGVVPGALAGGVAIAVVVLLAAVRTGNREGAAPNGHGLAAGVPPGTDFSLRHPYRALQRIAALSRMVSAGQWLTAIGLAFLNWLTDLGCLLASLRAVGLAVPVFAAATAYMATQLIRQIPATPGGVGLVEASLFLALTATGVGHAPGAAAIIVYRVLSCWAILPIGLMCWVAGKPTARALHHDAYPMNSG